MKIEELQRNDISDVAKEFMQKNIDEINDRWNKKQMDEAHYRSQLTICYGFLYESEECKKHAALVPDGAKAQEKTEALTSVARILIFEKKIEEALALYQQAYTLDANNEVTLEEAGWCCFELKRWEEAQDWFTKATVYLDYIENYWEGLGLSLARQEKYEEAVPAFKKAFEFCNKELEGHHYDRLIGECYANINDFYRALGYYTKSLDAKPTYAAALNDIAALYFNQEGDITNAIDYLKKAEAIAEKDDDDVLLRLVYNNLGNLYGKIKEFELQKLYKEKFFEKLGFGNIFDFESDDEDEE